MRRYTTIQGDTWDGISLKLYGNERYATLLMEHNQRHVHTMIFSAGVLLDVPDVPAQQAATLPPWKRGE
jgi:phage tail protein X